MILEREILRVVREHLRHAHDEHALLPGRALDEQPDRSSRISSVISLARSLPGSSASGRTGPKSTSACASGRRRAVELERHRLERERARLHVGLLDWARAEHATRARAEVEEVRLVVARALGKMRMLPPVLRCLATRARPPRCPTPICPARRGAARSAPRSPRRARSGAQDLPECGLRHRRDHARRLRQDEDRIDEPVDVVGAEQTSTDIVRGHVPGDLDLAE